MTSSAALLPRANECASRWPAFVRYWNLHSVQPARTLLWLGEDHRVFQRTILSAVVAAELYAGTGERREKRTLDHLCQAHQALGHFSCPPASSWIETGKFCGVLERVLDKRTLFDIFANVDLSLPPVSVKLRANESS